MTVHKAVYFDIKKYHAGISWAIEDASPVIPSDTVFSAICWAYSELFGIDEVEAFINVCRYGGLTLSSLYPSRVNGLQLFPLPYRYRRDIMHKLGNIKTAPRLVSKRVFEQLINRRGLESLELKAVGEVVYTNDELANSDKPFYRVSTTRNIMDRVQRATTPWRYTFYLLGEGYTLRLFYNIYGGVSEKKFTASLRLSSENGFGGERSQGFGYSESPPRFGEVEIDEPDNAGFFTTLSLYYPRIEEITTVSSSKEVWYELMERGGFKDIRMGGGRIGKVRMFREGSVLPAIQQPIGSLVDFGGVYRFGFAYPIKTLVE